MQEGDRNRLENISSWKEDHTLPSLTTLNSLPWKYFGISVYGWYILHWSSVCMSKLCSYCESTTFSIIIIRRDKIVLTEKGVIIFIVLFSILSDSWQHVVHLYPCPYTRYYTFFYLWRILSAFKKRKCKKKLLLLFSFCFFYSNYHWYGCFELRSWSLDLAIVIITHEHQYGLDQCLLSPPPFWDSRPLILLIPTCRLFTSKFSWVLARASVGSVDNGFTVCLAECYD